MGLRIVNAPIPDRKKGESDQRVRDLWQRVGVLERPARSELLGFGRGFAEAAVGFWREVKDKL
jgi:hypothetical protein